MRLCPDSVERFSARSGRHWIRDGDGSSGLFVGGHQQRLFCQPHIVDDRKW